MYNFQRQIEIRIGGYYECGIFKELKEDKFDYIFEIQKFYTRGLFYRPTFMNYNQHKYVKHHHNTPNKYLKPMVYDRVAPKTTLSNGAEVATVAPAFLGSQ